jgi:perosamine synthetase
MWFRLRPDIRYSDLGYALGRSLWPGRRARVLRDLAALWAGPEQTFACLSVRTGFDLVLEALRLPPGSEIVITALTIPDMVTIIQDHGLTPVPLDIAPDTLAPDCEELQRCLTARTKAIVVTHLFGARVPLEPILQVIGARPILVLEDCAQAFEGRTGYLGHPAADVAMFSFGPIKTSTALGGALLRVKDAALCRRLHDLESKLPVQPRRAFFLRACKYALLTWATSPPIWRIIARACLKRSIAYDPIVTKLARGFGTGPELIRKFRHRPATALLALLRRRLTLFDAEALRRRTAHGQEVRRLVESEVALPGAAADHCSYWVFPVVSPCRSEIIARLREEGFDASQRHTLGVVPTAGPSGVGSNQRTAALLQELLFVPAGAGMPDSEIARLAKCLRRLNPKCEAK